ncbi:MAG: hypothetical protein J6X49_13490 [Victivallales bacterium]|nr:hypothetical protein [Victivallales bacterium]
MKMKSFCLYIFIISMAILNTGCYALFRTSPNQSYLVEITSNPPGAYVWSDNFGNYLGKTPIVTRISPKNIQTLNFCKEDYYPEQWKIGEHKRENYLFYIDCIFGCFSYGIPIFTDIIFTDILDHQPNCYSQNKYHVNLTPENADPPENCIPVKGRKSLYETYPWVLDPPKRHQQNNNFNNSEHQLSAEQLQALQEAYQIIQFQNQEQLKALQQNTNHSFTPIIPMQTTPSPQPIRPMPTPSMPSRPSVNNNTRRNNTPSFKAICPKHGEYDRRAGGGCPACIAPKW